MKNNKLAITSYEQANGFSVVTTDELYFINGGSVTVANVMRLICAVSGCVALGAGMVASAASTPVTGPAGPAATVALWSGVVSAAAGVSASIAAIRE